MGLRLFISVLCMTHVRKSHAHRMKRNSWTSHRPIVFWGELDCLSLDQKFRSLTGSTTSDLYNTTTSCILMKRTSMHKNCQAIFSQIQSNSGKNGSTVDEVLEINPGLPIRERILMFSILDLSKLYSR